MTRRGFLWRHHLSRGDERATQAAALQQIPQQIVTYAAGFDWAIPVPANPSPQSEERDFFCCPLARDRYAAEGRLQAFLDDAVNADTRSCG